MYEWDVGREGRSGLTPPRCSHTTDCPPRGTATLTACEAVRRSGLNASAVAESDSEGVWIRRNGLVAQQGWERSE